MALTDPIGGNRRSGPKTPEGKTRSSRNALKHGLTARDAVLPEENEQDFLDLLRDLQDDLEPEGVVEETLVRHLAEAQWRLNRIARLETGILRNRMRVVREKDYEDDDDEDENEQEENDAPATERDLDTEIMASAFVMDVNRGDSLSKLSRYEGSLRRAFRNALADLRRSQDRRAARPPRKPPARAAIPELAPAPVDSISSQETTKRTPPAPIAARARGPIARPHDHPAPKSQCYAGVSPLQLSGRTP